MPNPAPFTPAELAYIQANYATAPRPDILAAVPGRTWNAIRVRAWKLGACGRPLAPPPGRLTWNAARLALMRELYPLPNGGALVVAATGLSLSAVRNCAVRLGIRTIRVRAKAVKVAKVAKVAKVRAVKVAKPKAPPLPQKPARVGTPNANAAASKKRRRAEVDVPIKAADISKLEYNHPGRREYSIDGIAGWVRWQQTQA